VFPFLTEIQLMVLQGEDKLNLIGGTKIKVSVKKIERKISNQK